MLAFLLLLGKLAYFLVGNRIGLGLSGKGVLLEIYLRCGGCLGLVQYEVLFLLFEMRLFVRDFLRYINCRHARVHGEISIFWCEGTGGRSGWWWLAIERCDC